MKHRGSASGRKAATSTCCTDCTCDMRRGFANRCFAWAARGRTARNGSSRWNSPLRSLPEIAHVRTQQGSKPGPMPLPRSGQTVLQKPSITGYSARTSTGVEWTRPCSPCTPHRHPHHAHRHPITRAAHSLLVVELIRLGGYLQISAASLVVMDVNEVQHPCRGESASRPHSMASACLICLRPLRQPSDGSAHSCTAHTTSTRFAGHCATAISTRSWSRRSSSTLDCTGVQCGVAGS